MCDLIKISQDHQLKITEYCLDTAALKITLIAIGSIVTLCGILGMIAAYHPGSLNAFAELGAAGSTAVIASGIFAIGLGSFLLKVKASPELTLQEIEPEEARVELPSFTFADWKPQLNDEARALMEKPIDEFLSLSISGFKSCDPMIAEVICFRLHNLQSPEAPKYPEGSLGWIHQTPYAEISRAILEKRIDSIALSFLSARQMLEAICIAMDFRISIDPLLWPKGLCDSSWISQWERYFIRQLTSEALGKILEFLPTHIFQMIEIDDIKEMSREIAKLQAHHLNRLFPSDHLQTSRQFECLTQETQAIVRAKLHEDHSVQPAVIDHHMPGVFATPKRAVPSTPQKLVKKPRRISTV